MHTTVHAFMEQTFVEVIRRLRADADKYFPMLAHELEMSMAILATLKIKTISQPLAVWLVGPPAIGKTTILEIIKGHPDVLWRDDITTAAILSGAAGVDESESLLPQLSDKTLVTPELAPLSKNKEAKTLLSYLTRLLDGNGMVRHTGYGRRGFSEAQRWNWLGAIVDVTKPLAHLMGTMGHRVMFIRMKKPVLTFDQRAQALISVVNTRPYKQKLEIMRDCVNAFNQVLNKFYPDGISWRRDNDDKLTMDFLSKLALLMVQLRGIFEPEGRGQFRLLPPEDEKRAFWGLYGAMQGFALINGRTRVTLDDLRIAVRLTLDSGPIERAEILKLMVGNKVVSTPEIVAACGCSVASACAYIDKMIMLGIGELVDVHGNTKPFKGIKLKGDYEWLRSKEIQQFL